MARDKKPSEGQLGYGRPPVNTRWGKGQSGNPKGRPKGSKNFATILQEELDSRVSVTENGRQRKISKRALIAKQFAKKAAEGDLKAITMMLLADRTHADDPRTALPAEQAAFDEAEKSMLANVVRRMKDSSGPDAAAEVQPSPLSTESKKENE